jgi:hypothetical protein
VSGGRCADGHTGAGGGLNRVFVAGNRAICGNSDANLPAVSLKNRKRGSSKVFFRFEMPLGFTGTCATHDPWRVSSANDTTSTAWGDAAIEP